MAFPGTQSKNASKMLALQGGATIVSPRTQGTRLPGTNGTRIVTVCQGKRRNCNNSFRMIGVAWLERIQQRWWGGAFWLGAQGLISPSLRDSLIWGVEYPALACWAKISAVPLGLLIWAIWGVAYPSTGACWAKICGVPPGLFNEGARRISDAQMVGRESGGKSAALQKVRWR
jgi:hypothetical protein